MRGVLNARGLTHFDKQYSLWQCRGSTVSQPNEQVAVLHCRTQ